MEIENEFTVPAPIDHVWAYLLDVERVAPCMPGAELTEVVDDTTWKGKVNMKLGPVSLSFAGTVTMQDRDDQAHRIVLAAQGMGQKRKSAAKPPVKMHADTHRPGTVAQLSRGLLPEVSRKLTQQFADCLAQSMGAAEVVATESADVADEASAEQAPVKARPIGGGRLGAAAVWGGR